MKEGNLSIMEIMECLQNRPDILDFFKSFRQLPDEKKDMVVMECLNYLKTRKETI